MRVSAVKTLLVKTLLVSLPVFRGGAGAELALALRAALAAAQAADALAACPPPPPAGSPPAAAADDTR